MAVQARSRELQGKFNFTVHDLSSGFTTAKFQQCTGAEITFAIAEYSEGGAAAPMKEATRASFSNVTLQHGITSSNLDFWTWCKQIVDMLANLPEGTGVASPNQLRNFTIRKRKRDRTVYRQLKLFNCQPARFNPGDQDNTSDDIDIEELELAYEYFAIA